MEILNRLVTTTEARLRDNDGRPDYGLNFYLIAKDGRHETRGCHIVGPRKIFYRR